MISLFFAYYKKLHPRPLLCFKRIECIIRVTF